MAPPSRASPESGGKRRTGSRPTHDGSRARCVGAMRDTEQESALHPPMCYSATMPTEIEDEQTWTTPRRPAADDSPIR
jgi:hypothetical protein